VYVTIKVKGNDIKRSMRMCSYYYAHNTHNVISFIKSFILIVYRMLNKDASYALCMKRNAYQTCRETQRRRPLIGCEEEQCAISLALSFSSSLTIIHTSLRKLRSLGLIASASRDGNCNREMRWRRFLK